MKKYLGAVFWVLSSFFLLLACSGGKKEFDPSKEINLVSREDGSGTRGAFIELIDIVEKDDQGNRKDKTSKNAIITNQTGIMMTNIAIDEYAVGYTSLGSLNHTVKALPIDGVFATPENIKDKSYPISRPFLIATKGEPSDLSKDFIEFILSKEGQAVVSENYIAILDDAPAYLGNRPTGKIVVAGSSSVTPVMEKLKEAYLKLNSNALIEIQQSDSSTGMNGAIDGTCDIGMASRELKESEAQQLKAITIALDGIVIIVNKNNPVDHLTKNQVKKMFSGEIRGWSEVIK